MLWHEGALQAGQISVGPDLSWVAYRCAAQDQRMWHAEGGDGSGDGGLHGRHRPGDPAAPAVPDDCRGALSQGSHDARDVGGQGERVVAAGWFVGGSVSAQVNRGHVVTSLGECDQLIALSQAGYHAVSYTHLRAH